MELGFVGLGRMGRGMVVRLVSQGHRVVAYDVSPQAVAGVASRGAGVAGSLEHLALALAPPHLADGASGQASGGGHL